LRFVVWKAITLIFNLSCTVSCTTGQLRLVEGTVANEGRVEICIDAVWGTVCDDFWESTDSRVVCQQLGYLTQGQKEV